jgi:hypothetical protein
VGETIVIRITPFACAFSAAARGNVAAEAVDEDNQVHQLNRRPTQQKPLTGAGGGARRRSKHASRSAFATLFLSSQKTPFCRERLRVLGARDGRRERTDAWGDFLARDDMSGEDKKRDGKKRGDRRKHDKKDKKHADGEDSPKGEESPEIPRKAHKIKKGDGDKPRRHSDPNRSRAKAHHKSLPVSEVKRASSVVLNDAEVLKQLAAKAKGMDAAEGMDAILDEVSRLREEKNVAQLVQVFHETAQSRFTFPCVDATTVGEVVDFVAGKVSFVRGLPVLC